MKKFIEFIKENTSEPQVQNQSEVLSLAGRNIFSSFMKCFNAFGGREVVSNITGEGNYLFFYKLYGKRSDVASVLSRFKSLQGYIHYIDDFSDNTELYFGVRHDGILEYGVSGEVIGSFKLSKTNIKWLLNSELKSLNNLKRDIVNLTFKDFILLGKIKDVVYNYSPGSFSNRLTPIIQDRTITFGFVGLGKWENGLLDNEQYLVIKNGFNDLLLSKRLDSKVLFNVKVSENNTIVLNIRLK